MTEKTWKKLQILAESAKYDASCSSSGSARQGRGGVGTTLPSGVCHSFSDDGRCISLLKVLLSNVCCYDCAYCINRSSNDIVRTSFAPAELAQLVMELYRRNYIEGLFLSSGVMRSPDHTMERMVQVVRLLRKQHGFHGYIHLKSIPGASAELVHQAGLYADRMSVNIEIPSAANLQVLAPDKNHESVYAPMRYVRDHIAAYREEKRRFRHALDFVPAGQSTQMIIGASNESDYDILRLAAALYTGPQLQRVYYSAFIPVNTHDTRLPAISGAPLVRENRLYQADWLVRLYNFSPEELVDASTPQLALDVDPKIGWALRHPEFFPLSVNTAEYTDLLRVPGIGIRSARRILSARRHGRLQGWHLQKIGVVMKRAQYFLVEQATPGPTIAELGGTQTKLRLLGAQPARRQAVPARAVQLSLFSDGQTGAAVALPQPRQAGA